MTKNSQALTQLVQKIAPGSQLRGIRPLSGGMSAEMIAFEIEDGTGQTRQMVWRSYKEAAFEPASSPIAREFRLLQITKSLELDTPTPTYLDLSGEIFAAPYLVSDYIEGQMLFAPVDWDDYLCQFASHLARIHNADYANYDLSFLPERGDGCAEIERKRPFSHPSLHETHIRQTLASRSPRPQRNPSTLLHGDYWPGNSLWQDEKLVAVIDWEEAGWGDPLIDLAKSRAEIVWIFGIAAMNSFTQHYQTLLPLNYSHLPYWDLCAALRFIRLFGHNLAEAGAFFIPFGRNDINEEAIRENFGYFIEQAFAGLIERDGLVGKRPIDGNIGLINRRK